MLVMSASSIRNSYTMMALGRKASEVSLAVIGDVEVVGKCISIQTLLTTVSASRMDVASIEKDKKEYLAQKEKRDAAIAKLESSVTDPQIHELLAKIAEMLPSFDKSSISVFDQAKSFMQEKAVRVVDEEVLPNFNILDQMVLQIKEKARLLAEEEPKSIVENAQRSVVHTAILALVTLVFAGACSFWVAQSITRSLYTVIRHIENSIQTMGGVTSDLTETSADLADSANQQAAAIEETSASLEELTGMTNQNAQHSEHATKISASAKEAASTGSSKIAGMLQAMEEITESSNDISKIIATIDNIAFQTNILALNAAVEAARAGESGAGFAVVADEVRNLARRSAAAARETGEKIEAAVKKSLLGAEISKTVSENLSGISSRSTELDALISEIASASKEQNQGIHLISKAVSQMNQITLNNASKAEKTAESTKDLREQMHTLEEILCALSALAGSSNAPQNSPSSHSTEIILRRP